VILGPVRRLPMIATGDRRRDIIMCRVLDNCDGKESGYADFRSAWGSRGSEIFVALTTGFVVGNNWCKSMEVGFLGGRERHLGAVLVVVLGKASINHVTFSHSSPRSTFIVRKTAVC